jgi:NitT/TauT family transport system substrate-binding protein
MKRFLARVAVVATAGLLAATGVSSVAAAQSDPVDVRLGYFGNVTHAPALVGIEGGIFDKKLGASGKVEPVVFTAGPAAIEAMLGGSIDASYIGPNPAINGFAQSNGELLRIVSGATSGGAYLVVKPEIKKAKDLEGKTLSTPQLGNTQDVALRTWLKGKGFETDETGGGDVKIVPQENAQALTQFLAGDIDGAWVPEPWATRMIQEGGGKILVDEADLWPDGQYVTTQLIVRKGFLDEHPDVVQKLVDGQVAANDYIAKNPQKAQDLVATGIEDATTKPIAPELVAASFKNLTFTNDPIASSLKKSAKNAEALGLLEPVDLKGIYKLSYLNKALKKAGEPTVKG